MLSEEVRDFARKIGQFYLQKLEGDYTLATQAVVDLQISKLEVRESDGSLAITTARPGLLIGVRGKNIDALTKYLGVHVKIIEEPDPLIHYLIPHEPPDPDEIAYEKAMDELYKEDQRERREEILSQLVQENQDMGFYD